MMSAFSSLPRQVHRWASSLALALSLIFLCAQPRHGSAQAPTLDDLWTGAASFDLEAANLGASFGFHFPSMLWHEGEIWAYYIKHQTIGGQTGFAVARARSANGVAWTDDGYVMKRGGDWGWIFQAQDLSHQTGRADADGWSASTSLDTAGYLCYGPYTPDLQLGWNEAGFHLMIDTLAGANDPIVQIEVYDATADQILTSQVIRRLDFPDDLSYQVFHLNFELTAWGHQIELRTYWFANAYVRQLSVAVAQGQYPHWDAFNSSFPGVWFDAAGSMFYMVYEGSDGTGTSPGDIGLAMADSAGLTFYRHAVNPILTHETSGWESVNIGTPSLRKDGGDWTVYYHGYDGADCQISHASGTDLLGLTKFGQPTLPTLEGTWCAGTTGKRSQLIQGPSGLYYMAYEGSTDQVGGDYGQARWCSGLARSADRIHWEPLSANPVVPLTTVGFGNDGPEMIQIGGWTYLYVRSASGGVDRYKLNWTSPVQLSELRVSQNRLGAQCARESM